MFANTQEAYEAIRSYFGRYGAKLAKNGDASSGLCRYLTDDGNKCAVGCLIPKALYDDAIENSTINPGWLKNNPALAILFKNVDLRFLRSAQILHDDVAKDARAFVRALDVLALAYGLNVPDSRFAQDELLTGEVKKIDVEVTVSAPEVEYAF